MTVVWRLPRGQTPNTFDPRYQDHDPQDSTINPDRFIVFHFHFDHLFNIGGQLRPGIYAIVAFHGQFYPPGPWTRVDGNGQHDRNIRTPILRCDRRNPNMDGTFFFYPGQYTDQEAERDLTPRGRLLAQFGNYLIRQGLMTAETFTGPRQGRLTLLPPDRCGLRRFDWGWTTRSWQFGANGADPPGRPGSPHPPPSGDGQGDDDGV